jgi:hypothetical protein
MKAREIMLCIHGSAKQSVPGGGRGRSNKSDPPAAGHGKAPVWDHKHWRPVTLVILFKSTNLNSFVAG